MSDNSWRIKRYYGPRVLIDLAQLETSPFQALVLCLSGPERSIVQNLMQYAHRRSTFVSEYHDDYYLAPSEEEWDEIDALVAGLEDRLMNCEEFTQMLEDILAAALCGCNSGKLGTYMGPLPGDGEPGEDVFEYTGTLPDGDVSPLEAACCAVAQLWYQFGYELITEQVLPATRFGFDWLVPAAAAAIALMVGGPGAAIGVYALAELIQELLEILYDGAETNLINWMESYKEELVCAMFVRLLIGGQASAHWASVYNQVVAPSEGISGGDKMILNLFMGQAACVDAKAAYDAATDWALANVTPGYCDACDYPPIQGDGWYAVPIGAGNQLMPKVTCVDDDGQTCWHYPVPSGQRMVGSIIEIQWDSEGLQHWPWRTNRGDNPEVCIHHTINPGGLKGECSGLPKTFSFLDDYYIDAQDCHDELNASGTLFTDEQESVVGPSNAQNALRMYGVDCAHLDYYCKYVVFEGTIP